MTKPVKQQVDQQAFVRAELQKQQMELLRVRIWIQAYLPVVLSVEEVQCPLRQSLWRQVLRRA